MNELAHLEMLDSIYNYLKNGRPLIPFQEIQQEFKSLSRPELSSLLSRLVEDKYVLRVDMGGGDESFSINIAYRDFDGYVFRYEKQKQTDSITHSKNWYDKANAERVYENYSSTRLMAIIALITSIAGLLVAIVSLRR